MNIPQNNLTHYAEDTSALAKKSKIPDFKINASALEKFRNIVRKLQKSIAVGTLVRDTVPLEKDYWLETLGMKLVIDGETFKGHIYTGYFLTETKQLEKWSTDVDEKGISYHEQYSFEEYLNQVVIPQFSIEEREEFKTKLSIVEYYTPQELSTLDAYFNEEGSVCMKSPHLNAWVEHKEAAPNSKESYTDFFQIYCPPSTNHLEDQHILKDQTYMYVLNHQGRLHLQIKNRGKTNHTSLSNGQAVLAAGSLKVKDGKIIEIDMFSGHYKPTEIQLITFLKYLKNSSINIDDIKVTYVGEYAIQPWKIHVINPNEVQNWLDKRIYTRESSNYKEI